MGQDGCKSAACAIPAFVPPTGAVTFAFTDIEGSTARWERDRVAMQDAVRRHDAILRDAIERHGGHVFKTIGDAFCAAFAQPERAVAAMVEAQRGVAAEDFSSVDGLRVRAAVHTGTSDERDGDYFGPALNKVARLLAIGHGSQILLTDEVAALLDGRLPDGVALRDLGAYHLKDFAEPQRLHQIVAPDLPGDFPPLRSLGTLPSDLSILDAQEFHPVPNFSGREDELAALDAALAQDGAIAVVHGLGGVGKSSVAREYGWRRRDRYSVVWWLNAQTEDGVIDGFLRLGAMFVHGLDQMKDRRAAAHRVLHSVLGGFDRPVLLVFDNLQDEHLMRSWLPRTGTRALATSRDAAWSTDVVPVPLQTWTPEVAGHYLQRASGRSDLTGSQAQEIARALGALPLALAHAAAALRALRMLRVEHYLAHINEHLKKAPRGAEYPRSVFATFTTAMAQAEHHAAGSAALLCFAAWFSADPIPDELFRQGADAYAEGLRPALTDGAAALDMRSAVADELHLDEALGALDRLSLLAFTEGSRTYTLHRLVQLAAQDLVEDNAGAWRACAVAVADAVFPEVAFATWPQCERLLPHALAALERLPENADVPAAATLANGCAEYLWQRGQFDRAERLALRALALHERSLGDEHPDVAKSLNQLARVYKDQGRFAEAEPLHARALWIRERTLGPNHPAVAVTLNNLAILYGDQGRYAEAEPLHLRAMAIREAALGQDHPDVAMSLDNLGVVYSYQGRHADAEMLYARALGIREKARGPDHPDVAFSLNNLALATLNLGRPEAAESLNERALAIREKTLGPDHPDVAYTLTNLAGIYHLKKRYAQAERFFLRAVAIREKALQRDHPDHAEVLYGLGQMYADERRFPEAEALLSRALAIQASTLGHDHAATTATQAALDALRLETGAASGNAASPSASA